MKKLLAILIAISVLGALVSPKETAQSQPQIENTPITAKISEPTSDEMNNLTLAYINFKQGTINCEKQQIDDWYFAACQVVSLNGNSAPQVWFYDAKKDQTKRFYALTGNARTVYGKYFKNEPMLGDYADTFGLPVPKNMDVAKIAKTFETKMK